MNSVVSLRPNGPNNDTIGELARRIMKLGEERRCSMILVRQELKSFSRACELLLSDNLEPRLTEEEQELITYYVCELIEKFGHKAGNSMTRVRDVTSPPREEETSVRSSPSD